MSRVWIYHVAPLIELCHTCTWVMVPHIYRRQTRRIRNNIRAFHWNRRWRLIFALLAFCSRNWNSSCKFSQVSIVMGFLGIHFICMCVYVCMYICISCVHMNVFVDSCEFKTTCMHAHTHPALPRSKETRQVWHCNMLQHAAAHCSTLHIPSASPTGEEGGVTWRQRHTALRAFHRNFRHTHTNACASGA